MHRRHQDARLRVRGVVDVFPQVLRRIGHRPGSDGRPAGKMRQIRSEPSGGYRACDGMAVDARIVLEDRPSFRGAAALGCRSRGWAAQVVKSAGESALDPQQHLGALRPAVLRALSEIEPSALGIDPHDIHLVWNHVHLARQPWNPEAVVCIR